MPTVLDRVERALLRRPIPRVLVGVVDRSMTSNSTTGVVPPHSAQTLSAPIIEGVVRDDTAHPVFSFRKAGNKHKRDEASYGIFLQVVT